MICHLDQSCRVFYLYCVCSFYNVVLMCSDEGTIKIFEKHNNIQSLLIPMTQKRHIVVQNLLKGHVIESLMKACVINMQIPRYFTLKFQFLHYKDNFLRQIMPFQGNYCHFKVVYLINFFSA